MGREAMVASVRRYWRRVRQHWSVCWLNARGSGISHEAFHLLAGEATGENDYVSLPNLLAGRELVKELLRKSVSRKNWLRRCYRCWRTGNQPCDARHLPRAASADPLQCDEQAAQAVLELAQ